MVDAVVHHWLTIAVTEAEKRRERGREGRHQAALFYADDGMLASSDPQWMQWAFTQIVGLFDRVELNTNSGKTVRMTCQPCSTMGNRSEEAYGRLMTGEGSTPRERKREKTTCGNCGREMAAGSLDSHRMTQHRKERERKWAWTDAATGGEKVARYKRTGWSSQGGDNGVPSRRVPGESRDMDGAARALLEEARAGHHYHLGGGKPPPSQMQKL